MSTLCLSFRVVSLYILMLVLSIFSRWDAEAEQRLHSLDGHRARVGALSWNQHWLSSGGRDSTMDLYNTDPMLTPLLWFIALQSSDAFLR